MDSKGDQNNDLEREAEEEEEEELYEVEHLLDVKVQGTKLMVKIKWLNFNRPEDATWEPFKNLNPETGLFFLREFRQVVSILIANPDAPNPRGITNLESKKQIVDRIIKKFKEWVRKEGVQFHDSNDESAEPPEKEQVQLPKATTIFNEDSPDRPAPVDAKQKPLQTAAESTQGPKPQLEPELFDTEYKIKLKSSNQNTYGTQNYQPTPNTVSKIVPEPPAPETATPDKQSEPNIFFNDGGISPPSFGDSPLPQKQTMQNADKQFVPPAPFGNKSDEEQANDDQTRSAPRKLQYKNPARRRDEEGEKSFERPTNSSTTTPIQSNQKRTEQSPNKTPPNTTPQNSAQNSKNNSNNRHQNNSFHNSNSNKKNFNRQNQNQQHQNKHNQNQNQQQRPTSTINEEQAYVPGTLPRNKDFLLNPNFIRKRQEVHANLSSTILNFPLPAEGQESTLGCTYFCSNNNAQLRYVLVEVPGTTPKTVPFEDFFIYDPRSAAKAYRSVMQQKIELLQKFKRGAEEALGHLAWSND